MNENREIIARSVNLCKAVSILSLFVVVFVMYLATNPTQNKGPANVPVGLWIKHFPIKKGNESLIPLPVLPKEEVIKNINKTFSLQNQSTSSTSEDSKVILVWYAPFGDKTMVLDFTLDEPSNPTKYKQSNQPENFLIDTKICGKCLVTFNQQKFEESNAVVFHAGDINSQSMPKLSRKSNQLFAWWLEESPLHAGSAGRNLKDYFDMIMYIRRSSDIFSPYSSFPFLLHMMWNKKAKKDTMFSKSTFSEDQLNLIISKLSNTSIATACVDLLPTVSKNLGQFIKKKSRLAVWIVSNCGCKLRFDFYNKLKSNGLKVDVYGKCGTGPFPVKDRFNQAFFDIIGRYKFYLAFENSFHCKDYLTEKLWFNSLYSGAVPIIFGPHSEDVAAVLPPKSYIHAEDFANPHELVTYLEYLDRNATAYSEYLEWRDLVNFLDNEGNFDAKLNLKSSQNFTKNQLKAIEYAKPSATGFCGLCRKLNDGMNTTKKIHDIGEYINNDRPECFNDKLARQMIGL